MRLGGDLQVVANRCRRPVAGQEAQSSTTRRCPGLCQDSLRALAADVAEAAVYLAGGAAWMTGRTLVLDGGALIAFGGVDHQYPTA